MPQTDLSAYLPIALMFVVVVGFSVVSLGLARVLAPRRPTPEKLEPYECGIVPTGDARERFSVKFYLVAMVFILFDIEAVFLVLVLSGFFYIWKKGALDWSSDGPPEETQPAQDAS